MTQVSLEQSETPINEKPTHPTSTQFPVATLATNTLSYSSSDASIYTIELLSTEQPIGHLSEKRQGKSPQIESPPPLPRATSVSPRTLSANVAPQPVSSHPFVAPTVPPSLVSPASTSAVGEPSVVIPVDSPILHQAEYPRPVTHTTPSAQSCAAPAISVPAHHPDVSPLLPVYPPMLLRSQSLPTSADNTSDGRPGFKPTTTTHPHSPVSPSPPGEPLQLSPEAHGQSTLRPEDSSQPNSTFPTPATYVAYNHYDAMFRQAQQGQQWKAQAAECRTLLNMFAKKIIELDRKTRANISEAMDTWTDDDRAKLVDKINVLEQENLIQSRQIMVLQENQTYLSNRLQSLTDDMAVISRKHYCDRKAWEQTLSEKENTLRESQRLLGESALTYSQYRNLLRKYLTESAQLNEAVQQSDWDHVVYIIRRMGTGKRS